MASKIEWTDETWNPVVGCDLVSPGCTNCYAMKMAGRLEAMADAEMAKTGAAGPLARYQGTTRKTKVGPVWTGLINAAPDDVIAAPLRWRKPRKVFVNSMSDLFAPGVPRDLVDRVWAVMAASPQHTYQILTKRPAEMRAYVKDILSDGMIRLLHTWVDHPTGRRPLIDLVDVDHIAAPLPNVWLFVSAEDQERLDERVPILLDTPAAVRGLSAEPLLGPLSFYGTSEDGKHCHDYLTGMTGFMCPDGPDFDHGAGLDLVIVGGENALKARQMYLAWVRRIRDRCAEARKPFFFKQWGTWLPVETADDGAKAYLVPADGSDDLPAYDRLQDKGPWPTRRKDGEEWAKVGKKLAGRLLDGVEHNAMPELAHG